MPPVISTSGEIPNPSSADALKTEPPPNDPRISEGRRAVETDLLCKSLQLKLMDPKRRGPLARLMAGWLATRSDPWVVGLGLGQARQYRLPEVVPVARQGHSASLIEGWPLCHSCRKADRDRTWLGP